MLESRLAGRREMPDKTAMRIASLILAGGRSIRMGQPKESLPFRGGTLLGHLAAELQKCSAPVVVVARGGDQILPALPPGVLVTTDERPAGGPLWGMRSGLLFLQQPGQFGAGDAVFVGACDMPFVRADFVLWLVSRLGSAQLVMPRMAGVLQPLCAVYRFEVLPAIDELLARDVLTPRALTHTVASQIVDESDLVQIDPFHRCVENINTPEDYARALRLSDR